VSLRESTITWSTVKYATNAGNGFVSGSLDKTTIIDRTFRTHVIENRYLKETLLPEFGGRILSIIYKPRTTLSHGRRRALRDQGRQFLFTGGAEIVAPIQAYSTPDWSANLADDDKGLGLGQSRFEKLRYFRNWPTSTRKTEIAFPRRFPPAAAANGYS
jgi:hypothetical protein